MWRMSASPSLLRIFALHTIEGRGSMPRRKSNATGGQRKDSLEGSPADALGTPDAVRSDLPVAGAESAHEPESAIDPDAAGTAERPTAEAADTVSAGFEADAADTVAAGLESDSVLRGEDSLSSPGAAPDSTPEPEPEPWSGDILDPVPPEPEAPAPASPVTESPLSEPVLPEAVTEPAPAESALAEPTWREPLHTEPASADSGLADPALTEPASGTPPVTGGEPPAPPPHAPDTHEDEDEGGTSVAAWALGILLLLLAGAALGTWAAPRIAPHLPAGMKPVADWLEPGGAEADAEIATLQTELDDLKARLGEVPSASELDTRIGAAVTPVESRLSDELTTLRQAVGQVDPTETRQRLEEVAAGLKGQAAQLETLKGQFEGAAGQVTGDVNVFKSDIEGVRAELASLRDQVSAQATRLDEVAKSAETRVAAAEQQATEAQEKATTEVDAAEVNAQGALVRAALASGAPYADAVAALQARGVAVPPSLAEGAQSGVATLATLRDTFPDAAHKAIQASIVASAAGEGVLARANAYLKAQMASRSLTPRPGPGTDAVLSRMEDKLRHDDLAGALAESQALPSEAAAAMADWLAAAKLRAGAADGIAALASSLPATN